MRDHYSSFQERSCEIVVVGPDSTRAFAALWQQEQMPFIGLPDPKHTVLELYRQRVDWLRLGRLPTQALIDIHGTLLYLHHGRSMADIPSPQSMLDHVLML